MRLFICFSQTARKAIISQHDICHCKKICHHPVFLMLVGLMVLFDVKKFPIFSLFCTVSQSLLYLDVSSFEHHWPNYYLRQGGIFS